YHWLERLAVPAFVLSIVLLILCFVPNVGVTVNGASRWISGKAMGLGSLQGQPSELAKIAAVVILAAWYAKSDARREKFLEGFLMPLLILGVIVGLVGAEVDIGSAALIATGGLVVMFAAGVRWRYLGAMAFVGLSSAAALAVAFQTSVTMQNRLARVMAFLDPEAHKTGLGLQQWRALLAFGSGGVDGLGLGQGRQKMLYLPFAHTDFIFPMVGEELGLPYTLAVVFCFVLITISGLLIAGNAPDRFGKLLGTGIVTLLIVQAVLNIGVTTCVLPNKGLPLPFVSYGGSNLICCLIGVGILLNIYRQGIVAPEKEHATILRMKMTPRV
ncbi:MAG: FtsW/RodA/SpoVE family cell cycle protein, partial [Verrucomicrobiales bacterium]